MSKPSIVIQTLQEIAARDLNKAAERLAESNKQLSDAKNQLDMLQQYRQDYISRYADMLAEGMNIEALQNYQSFLRKLDQAISGQEQIIESFSRQVKHHMGLWQECQKKKLSYDVLSERSQRRAYVIESKRDQKMMDEFASRSKRLAHS